MGFSKELLEEGSHIWEAQYEHSFVTELAEGTLDPEAFQHWIKQDYRYLLDYARTFALAGTKARREETMAGLFDVAHTVLNYEMDLHREFAAEYGIDPEELEAVQKAPTCIGYTNFLVRTAYEGTLPEIIAAIYPCGQGYLDVAKHMQELATEEHRYTPFIDKYTSDEFYDAVDQMRTLVNRCAEDNPGEREAMREAFLTSARLEHQFWEMCYTQEGWSL
jgi:thiaminase/transcriptional activator TenA